MIVEINADTAINIAPASVEEEIIRNVAFLLATRRGTACLARYFGIDNALLDSPITAARDSQAAEIIEALAQYEPRAIVESVSWTAVAVDGILAPTVRIQIGG